MIICIYPYTDGKKCFLSFFFFLSYNCLKNWYINLYCYSDFMTLYSIIMELIEAGAHIDTVNSNGKTPYESVATGMLF